MKNDCCIDFQELVNENLKQDPEFKKGLQRADKKLKLELKFNEMLRQMKQDKMFFVEVKDIDDY